MITTFIEALSIKFPNVQAHTLGDGNEYELLVHIGNGRGDPMPTKQQLEAAILEIDQDKIWRQIQGVRDTRKAAGVRVGTNWFHSDDTSRIQQLGLVMFGANLPPNLMWKTLSGAFVLMTPTLAQQIFMTIGFNDQQIFARAEYHKAEMLKVSKPSLYDFSGGWPPIYGE